MILDKKFVILAVPDGAKNMLLPGAPEGELLVFGKVTGETPNVGLWVTILAVSSAGVQQEIALSNEMPQLVQWRSISAAAITDGIAPTVYGFRPRSTKENK